MFMGWLVKGEKPAVNKTSDLEWRIQNHEI